MKRNDLLKKSINVAVAAGISATTAAAVAQADWQQIGVMGDLNNDGKANVADLVLMTEHINNKTKLTNNNAYFIDYAYVGLNGRGFRGEKYFCTADINEDNIVDVFDLIMLKKYVADLWSEPVWKWYDEEIPQEITTTTTTEIAASTETTTTTVSTTEQVDPNAPIFPPVNDITRNVPSQGEADIVIFYVDFPDCKYKYDLSAEQVDEIAFGGENTYSTSYPFDSISAFYNRSSNGISQIKGKTFRYTAKENISSYDNDKKKLLKECYKAFEDSADFRQFDGDGNGVIDATIITVPEESDDDAWWACAGPSGLDAFLVDGMKVGHLITGDCEITPDNNINFVRNYSHEIGHGMGLPDYYRYVEKSNPDFDGLHGLAGIDLMDDALSDFGAVSKLHLGWYKNSQIQVYDYSKGMQTYTLSSSQTENSNCLIIPCGELDSKYKSEYFVIEYNTNDRNNAYMRDVYYNEGSGIRVYHVNAEIYDNGYWVSYKYESNDSNSDGSGKRFIRITDDVEGYDNYYHTGDIIDSSVSGFCWYDENGLESVDPNVRITIGELTENGYTVTVENT